LPSSQSVQTEQIEEAEKAMEVDENPEEEPIFEVALPPPRSQFLVQACLWPILDVASTREELESLNQVIEQLADLNWSNQQGDMPQLNVLESFYDKALGFSFRSPLDFAPIQRIIWLSQGKNKEM